jgi:hypothetical protein
MVSISISACCRFADSGKIAGIADKTADWALGRSALIATRMGSPAEEMTVIDYMHFQEQFSRALKRQRHISGRLNLRLVEQLATAVVSSSRKAPIIVSKL